MQHPITSGPHEQFPESSRNSGDASRQHAQQGTPPKQDQPLESPAQRASPGHRGTQVSVVPDRPASPGELGSLRKLPSGICRQGFISGYEATPADLLAFRASALAVRSLGPYRVKLSMMPGAGRSDRAVPSGSGKQTPLNRWEGDFGGEQQSSRRTTLLQVPKHHATEPIPQRLPRETHQPSKQFSVGEREQPITDVELSGGSRVLTGQPEAADTLIGGEEPPGTSSPKADAVVSEAIAHVREHQRQMAVTMGRRASALAERSLSQRRSLAPSQRAESATPTPRAEPSAEGDSASRGVDLEAVSRALHKGSEEQKALSDRPPQHTLIGAGTGGLPRPNGKGTPTATAAGELDDGLAISPSSSTVLPAASRIRMHQTELLATVGERAVAQREKRLSQRRSVSASRRGATEEHTPREKATDAPPTKAGLPSDGVDLEAVRQALLKQKEAQPDASQPVQQAASDIPPRSRESVSGATDSGERRMGTTVLDDSEGDGTTPVPSPGSASPVAPQVRGRQRALFASIGEVADAQREKRLSERRSVSASRRGATTQHTPREQAAEARQPQAGSAQGGVDVEAVSQALVKDNSVQTEASQTGVLPPGSGSPGATHPPSHTRDLLKTIGELAGANREKRLSERRSGSASRRDVTEQRTPWEQATGPALIKPDPVPGGVVLKAISQERLNNGAERDASQPAQQALSCIATPVRETISGVSDLGGRQDERAVSEGSEESGTPVVLPSGTVDQVVAQVRAHERELLEAIGERAAAQREKRLSQRRSVSASRRGATEEHTPREKATDAPPTKAGLPSDGVDLEAVRQALLKQKEAQPDASQPVQQAASDIPPRSRESVSGATDSGERRMGTTVLDDSEGDGTTPVPSPGSASPVAPQVRGRQRALFASIGEVADAQREKRLSERRSVSASRRGATTQHTPREQAAEARQPQAGSAQGGVDVEAVSQALVKDNSVQTEASKAPPQTTDGEGMRMPNKGPDSGSAEARKRRSEERLPEMLRPVHREQAVGPQPEKVLDESASASAFTKPTTVVATGGDSLSAKGRLEAHSMSDADGGVSGGRMPPKAKSGSLSSKAVQAAPEGAQHSSSDAAGVVDFPRDKQPQEQTQLQLGRREPATAECGSSTTPKDTGKKYWPEKHASPSARPPVENAFRGEAGADGVDLGAVRAALLEHGGASGAGEKKQDVKSPHRPSRTPVWGISNVAHLASDEGSLASPHSPIDRQSSSRLEAEGRREDATGRPAERLRTAGSANAQWLRHQEVLVNLMHRHAAARVIQHAWRRRRLAALFSAVLEMNRRREQRASGRGRSPVVATFSDRVNHVIALTRQHPRRSLDRNNPTADEDYPAAPPRQFVPILDDTPTDVVLFKGGQRRRSSGRRSSEALKRLEGAPQEPTSSTSDVLREHSDAGSQGTTKSEGLPAIVLKLASRAASASDDNSSDSSWSSSESDTDRGAGTESLSDSRHGTASDDFEDDFDWQQRLRRIMREGLDSKMRSTVAGSEVLLPRASRVGRHPSNSAISGEQTSAAGNAESSVSRSPRREEILSEVRRQSQTFYPRSSRATGAGPTGEPSGKPTALRSGTQQRSNFLHPDWHQIKAPGSQQRPDVFEKNSREDFPETPVSGRNCEKDSLKTSCSKALADAGGDGSQSPKKKDDECFHTVPKSAGGQERPQKHLTEEPCHGDAGSMGSSRQSPPGSTSPTGECQACKDDPCFCHLSAKNADCKDKRQVADPLPRSPRKDSPRAFGSPPVLVARTEHASVQHPRKKELPGKSPKLTLRRSGGQLFSDGPPVVLEHTYG